MRPAIIRSLVRFATTLVVVAAAAFAAQAQAAAQGSQPAAGRLRLDALERLAPKAAETVDIEIDGFLIKFAGSILSDKDEEERAVKEVITGLKGVYVKSYEFKAEGQYTEADLGLIRDQLRAPGWSRIVDVKSRGLDFGDAELYVATAGDRVEGLALLVVEPKQVTVINLVGAVDMDKLKKLEGRIRLPGVRVRRRKGGDN